MAFNEKTIEKQLNILVQKAIKSKDYTIRLEAERLLELYHTIMKMHNEEFNRV